jgi:hypothetical protein
MKIRDTLKEYGFTKRFLDGKIIEKPRSWNNPDATLPLSAEEAEQCVLYQEAEEKVYLPSLSDFINKVEEVAKERGWYQDDIVPIYEYTNFLRKQINPLMFVTKEQIDEEELTPTSKVVREASKTIKVRPPKAVRDKIITIENKEQETLFYGWEYEKEEWGFRVIKQGRHRFSIQQDNTLHDGFTPFKTIEDFTNPNLTNATIILS